MKRLKLLGDGETAETAEARMTENGLQFSIDLLGGQKTGAFLDQRENRAVAGTYARGRALDCFTFQGSFALHMARRCDQVTAIDISAPAIERAKQNAALNDIDNIDFKECVRCNVCEVRLIERAGVCKHDLDKVQHLIQIKRGLHHKHQPVPIPEPINGD